MVSDNLFAKTFNNETVFVTGHTGFIGSWLSFWLNSLGAKVIGYSLEPPSDKSFFQSVELENDITHIIGDINNQKQLTDSIKLHKPKFVFHLAAQSLVRLSYEQPFETFQTNVLGTANVLEAIRNCPSVRVGIIMTSDKCYENRELDYAYKETDPMGGHDPYSASKGAAELVTSSYRNSFFNPNDFEKHKVSISTIRAGNVIGGGDWANDRIIPDCINFLTLKQPILVRNPNSIRPWQYVLEPISGILTLAVKMSQNSSEYGGPWNFGPLILKNKTTVKDLVIQIIKEWNSGEWTDISEQVNSVHEANLLMLDSTKAMNLLGWKPVYSIDESIHETINWYKEYVDKTSDIQNFSLEQIQKYVSKAKEMNLFWSH